MEMLGTRQLGVTQQQAWEALNDPETLKACLAGCDKFEPAGDDTYVVGMAVKVGPVSAKFTGKVALTEITPPQSYKLSFEGQGGVAGFGKGSPQRQPGADSRRLRAGLHRAGAGRRQGRATRPAAGQAARQVDGG